MNLLLKKISLMMVFMIATSYTAQEIDESRYQNVIRQLKFNKSQVKEDLSVEKKMPNAEDSYIIVIPILIGYYQHDGFSVQNTILITDEKGVIKNKYTDPEEYDSDAIMLQKFSIDTGLYILNSKNRAFGVAAIYRNGSQPNPYSSQEISLYLPYGQTMIKV